MDEFPSSGRSWSKHEIDRKINFEFSKNPQHSNRPKQKYFVHISELTLKPPQWLVEGILERDCLVGLIGASGSGKSFVAVDLACSIASGTLFHGRATQPGNVLYVAGEGQRGLVARVEAWCRTRDLNRNDLSFHISQQKIQMHNDDAVKHIAEEAKQIGNVVLIIIDTLARSFGGHNENSTQDMNHFINNCDEFLTEERSVLVAHHSGHNHERARGNSAFYAALDTELNVKKFNNDITVTCTKMKDAPDFEPLNFLLVPISLEVEGQEFKTCHLEEVEPRQRQGQRPLKLSQIEKLGLETLKSGTKDNVPPSGLHLEDWRPLFNAGHTGDNQDTKKKAFQRAREGLVRKGIIEVSSDYYSVRDSGT